MAETARPISAHWLTKNASHVTGSGITSEWPCMPRPKATFSRLLCKKQRKVGNSIRTYGASCFTVHFWPRWCQNINFNATKSSLSQIKIKREKHSIRMIAQFRNTRRSKGDPAIQTRQHIHHVEPDLSPLPMTSKSAIHRMHRGRIQS